MEDPHTKRACEIFGVTPDKVTPEMRRKAKADNYAVAYGVDPEKMKLKEEPNG